MDYILVTGSGDYICKSLEDAYDRFDSEDTAIMYKRGYINGEWHEELIDEKYGR